ncbi:hypothetical protein ACU635_22530 [[Actinomadura] parvosata]|uniref:hypothetical protein n=1 Tax=[Actinomadura] parvosata TaxID=1955412 RepID=UPI00406D370D
MGAQLAQQPLAAALPRPPHAERRPGGRLDDLPADERPLARVGGVGGVGGVGEVVEQVGQHVPEPLGLSLGEIGRAGREALGQRVLQVAGPAAGAVGHHGAVGADARQGRPPPLEVVLDVGGQAGLAVHEQLHRPFAPAQRLAVRRRQAVEHHHDVEAGGAGAAAREHAAADVGVQGAGEELFDEGARGRDGIHARQPRSRAPSRAARSERRRPGGALS